MYMCVCVHLFFTSCRAHLFCLPFTYIVCSAIEKKHKLTHTHTSFVFILFISISWRRCDYYVYYCFYRASFLILIWLLLLWLLLLGMMLSMFHMQITWMNFVLFISVEWIIFNNMELSYRVMFHSDPQSAPEMYASVCVCV